MLSTDKDFFIDSIMSSKEDPIMMKKEYSFDPLYSLDMIIEIFESIDDTFNFYNKHIYKHKDLTISIYKLSNFEIVCDGINYSLGEYIILKIIKWGRQSYSDLESKLFLFQLIRSMDKFDISVFLDDFYKQENGYFDSSLNVKRDEIEKIKVQADIILIGILIKKLDISDSYKEYNHLIPFHPDYLYSDRSGLLFYNDFNRELLQLSLKMYFEQDVICNFVLDDYKSYLAYLSLIKYYINCDNSISSSYSFFIESVFKFG